MKSRERIWKGKKKESRNGKKKIKTSEKVEMNKEKEKFIKTKMEARK